MNVDPSRLENIFHEALAREDAEARRVFLDEACRDQPELRQRVEALLLASDTAGSFLKLPGVDPNDRTASYSTLPTEAVGARIGRYKLLQQIGEGGFGIVFMAEQEEPVRRKVALKIIKLGMDTRQVIARFEAERQALAIMDHPSVAKVFDGGATEAGRPYFVMELVKGAPITAYCDQLILSIRRRLELFAQVCQAVQHAHQKGLIHRDLKPSNILVSTQDDRPLAKVIDFGVAKATQSPLTEKTVFTEFHQLIGTPAYMSPEQANGNLDIDTRSDVYSLGVILYELLTGSPPFDPKFLRSKAFAEMQQIIREVEPPTPSSRLSTSDALPNIAAHRATEPKKLHGQLLGELDWIVMKCLEKDRQRRYESASALATDVMRHLADEPVSAGPPSTVYKLRKFARKNKTLLIAGSTCAALLFVGTAISLWQAVRATSAQTLADARLIDFEEANASTAKALEQSREEQRLARAVSEYLVDAFRKPDPELDGREVKVVDILDQAVLKLDTAFVGSERIKGELLDVLGRTYLGLGLSKKAVSVFEKSRSLLQSILPAGHDDLLTSMGNLASAYKDAGRISEALPLAKEALQISIARFGATDRRSAVYMGNLALVYRDAGQPDKALPLLEQSLTMFKSVSQPSDREMLITMNNLALAYEEAGRFADALPLHEETMRRTKAALGAEDPNTLQSMNNLAITYARMGQLDKARPLVEETYRITTQKLGDDHPLTLLSINNLAMVYRLSGQLREAIPLFKQALELRRANKNTTDADLLLSLHNLATAYDSAGENDKAKPLFDEMLTLTKATLPVGHPERAIIFKQIALAYEFYGRDAEAESLLRELIEVQQKTLGKAAERASLQTRLGLVLLKQSKYPDAEQPLRDALAIRQKEEPGAWTTFFTQSTLGDCLARQKHFAEAEPMLLAGYEGMKAHRDKIPASSRIRLIEAVERIVRHYEANDKQDNAAKWRRTRNELVSESGNLQK